MRLHLFFALVTALLLFLTLPRTRHHDFGFPQVEKIARDRSLTKYLPTPNNLPLALQKLSPQQQAGIFWKDDYRLWRKKGLPFQVDFYHVSREFPTGPRIYTVDRKGAHPLAYSPTFFNFSGLAFNPPLPATLNYAGFYLRYPGMIQGSRPNSLDGFFTTQGTSYFRVLARNQVYGLSARALGLNSLAPGSKTGEIGKAEEFPVITDWWLREPLPGATEVVLDALLDSPSVTGAYEFRLRPGSSTSVAIHASLFFRKDVAQLGLAPFSSMYLYGENAKNHFGDNVHPEVHDSDGLLVDNGKGEWSWRPLQQTPMQQLYFLDAENPRGFGLIQRDRDFQHYQDLDAKYNVRPSAWVAPRGNWGKGQITLFQLATNNTNTDNVILFWKPDHAPRAGDHLTVDYTIDFYMNDASRPPLAWCRSTFINDPAPPPAPAPSVSPNSPPSLATAPPPKGAPAPKPPPPPPPKKPADLTTPVQFLVDFAGNGLEDLPANAPPDLDLAVDPPQTVIRESRVEKNGYDNSWRVTFTIVPFKHFVGTHLRARLLPHATVTRLREELAGLQAQIDRAQQTKNTAELDNLTRTVLPQKQRALQEAATHPLTETWTYTWHQ